VIEVLLVAETYDALHTGFVTANHGRSWLVGLNPRASRLESLFKGFKFLRFSEVRGVGLGHGEVEGVRIILYYLAVHFVGVPGRPVQILAQLRLGMLTWRGQLMVSLFFVAQPIIFSDLLCLGDKSLLQTPS
jgi:hypothetical protein